MIAAIDFVFLAIILIFVIGATVRGFIDEFFSRAAFVVALICAFCFHRFAERLFAVKIPSPTLYKIAAFLAVFVAAFLVAKLVQALLAAAFHSKALRSLDKALGALFGFAEGALVTAAIIWLLQIQPIFSSAKLLGNSAIASKIQPVLNAILGAGYFAL